MTEASERIASLEANMTGLLKLADKWDQVLVQVTEINSNLSHSIRQTDTYQKTCEAERSAHGQRISGVENAIKELTELSKALPKHEDRLNAVERHIARGSTVWWLIVKIAISVGGLAGFAASIVAVMTVWHR